MQASLNPRGGRIILAGALAAASVLAVSGGARAAAPAWLKHAFALHRARPPAPAVERFTIEAGGAFTLDRSLGRPLLKFDDSPEVWALTASRGPRGDMIYLNDSGQPVLRTTRLGGVTVFTPRRPEGAAAADSGAGAPLRLASIGPERLYQRLVQASARSSRAAQHLIAFEVPDADSNSDGLIADAAGVASEAIVLLATRYGGRTVLTRVTKVVIEMGRLPGAALRGGVIYLTVAPPQGVAGRPSSERILVSLGAR
jgi:hypothetical protein